MAGQRTLTIIYGAAAQPRNEVARALAASLPGKAAVVSVDSLMDAIVQPDSNAIAELELVHTQLRLLVANYLKNGYDVVVQGPFAFERDGQRVSYESDIDQLQALMRNLTRQSLIVRVFSSAEPDDYDAAYKPRGGERYREFDYGSSEPREIAESIKEVLQVVDG